ncbi:hypothetical protein AAC387_Pa06g0119 [Persea americana]
MVPKHLQNLQPFVTKNKRHVCFRKRRKGLFQKASEGTLCDTQVAIIVFSGGGRPFLFGHPTTDAFIDRFLSATDPVPPDVSHSSHSHSELIFNRIAQLQQQQQRSQLPMKEENSQIGGSKYSTWTEESPALRSWSE